MSQSTTSILMLLYACALLQTSFLVHVFPSGMVPNLIVLTVVAISFFEKLGSHGGYVAAVFGGLLLDLFSTGFIGTWVATLLVVTLAIKFILLRYVRLPISQGT